MASRRPSPRAEDVARRVLTSYSRAFPPSTLPARCVARRGSGRRPHTRTSAANSSAGRAGLEPVRHRLKLRRQFPKRPQRRPPLTGFDAADLRIGDARPAEVPLREAERSPPLPDAVTGRAWVVAYQVKGRRPGVTMAVLAGTCQPFSVGRLNAAPASGSRPAHRPGGARRRAGAAKRVCPTEERVAFPPNRDTSRWSGEG